MGMNAVIRKVSPMSRAVIACKTIEDELRIAMEQTGCDYPVRLLESGLHNWPDRLRREVQRLLETCRGCDTVLLAMSLCGNAMVGLETGEFTLVIPRCDDCITLLLGSQERRREWPDAYFLTRGWLESDLSLRAEYRKTLEKYGEKRGKRIFSAMLAHYRRLVLVDTGGFDAQKLLPEVEALAGELNLEPLAVPGTLDYLKDLLAGPWGSERFLVVPPHSRVTM